MRIHSRDRRKIDPEQGTQLADGSPNAADGVEIGPTRLARAEWQAAGLALPDIAGMRAFRWRRLTDHVMARDLAGLLMFDPMNIRYATDSTNMQIWNTHNPFRAVLLAPDGHMVLFDYSKSPFLADHLPLVAEVRSGASMFYFAAGEGADEAARRFAADVAAILARHAPGERRLAVDKIMPRGLDALRQQGFEITDGEEVTEKARAVKGREEIAAMRCAVHACEAAMAEMEAFARAEVPRGDVSEADIWAELHAGNIRRGGEWIETRLLTSGPRTNPWFQECGPRIVGENEIVAFDTDLVGAYGICVDISRTWWIGPGRPRDDMRAAMAEAREHIERNIELLRPGASFAELSHGGHHLAPRFRKMKYSCKFHGVGLCDEWPHIDYPDSFDRAAWDHALEPGMVLTAEALVAEDGGDFSIKLEDQVLVTEAGPERLSRYPFDPALSAPA